MFGLSIFGDGRACQRFLLLSVRPVLPLSGWEGRMEAHTATLGVSAVVALLLFSVFVWLELETGWPLTSLWFIGPLFAGVFGADYLIFMANGRGELFRDQFDGYPPLKQRLLYVAASSFVFVVAVLTYISISEFRRVHGIVN